MKRTFVFLLLGPTSVVSIPLILIIKGGGSLGSFVQFFAIVLFFFTFIVSVLTGPIDAFLAHTLPLLLRAPLTAIVGAINAGGLFLAFFGNVLWGMWMIFAIGGALCMGTCSLLANDYGGRKRQPTAPANR